MKIAGLSNYLRPFANTLDAVQSLSGGKGKNKRADKKKKREKARQAEIKRQRQKEVEQNTRTNIAKKLARQGGYELDTDVRITDEDIEELKAYNLLLERDKKTATAEARPEEEARKLEAELDALHRDHSLGELDPNASGPDFDDIDTQILEELGLDPKTASPEDLEAAASKLLEEAATEEAGFDKSIMSEVDDGIIGAESESFAEIAGHSVRSYSYQAPTEIIEEALASTNNETQRLKFALAYDYGAQDLSKQNVKNIFYLSNKITELNLDEGLSLNDPGDVRTALRRLAGSMKDPDKIISLLEDIKVYMPALMIAQQIAAFNKARVQRTKFDGSKLKGVRAIGSYLNAKKARAKELIFGQAAPKERRGSTAGKPFIPYSGLTTVEKAGSRGKGVAHVKQSYSIEELETIMKAIESMIDNVDKLYQKMILESLYNHYESLKRNKENPTRNRVGRNQYSNPHSRAKAIARARAKARS